VVVPFHFRDRIVFFFFPLPGFHLFPIPALLSSHPAPAGTKLAPPSPPQSIAPPIWHRQLRPPILSGLHFPLTGLQTLRSLLLFMSKDVILHHDILFVPNSDSVLIPPSSANGRFLLPFICPIFSAPLFFFPQIRISLS